MINGVLNIMKIELKIVFKLLKFMKLRNLLHVIWIIILNYLIFCNIALSLTVSLLNP